MSHSTRARTAGLGWLSAAVLAGLSLAAAPSPSERPGPPESEAAPDAPLPPGEARRPLPRYSPRTEPPPLGDTLLWVPRILFFPAYLVSESLRRPLGALMSYAEEHHWQARWYDFFTFGPEQHIGLFPTGRIDTGLHPSLGIYFFWDDVLGQSDLRLRVTSSGWEAWSVRGLWRWPLGDRRRLEVAAGYAQHRDRVFYGLGPAAPNAPARYAETRLEGRSSYVERRDQLTFSSYEILRGVSFDGSEREHGERSLNEAIALGALAAPPALEDGYVAAISGLFASFDSRAPRLSPAPRTSKDVAHRGGSGLAAAVRVEHGSGLARTRTAPADPARLPQWLGYAAQLTGALDVTDTRRTLEVTTRVELVDPLRADSPVPFTEQVSLGGQQPLRAFRAGRLVDRSAAVATFSYRWPVWGYLDGSLHYAVGNVFGSHLSGIRPGLLRSSFGIALDSVGSMDQPFEVLLAFGTEPFEAGGHVESVRFVLGTRAGF